MDHDFSPEDAAPWPGKAEPDADREARETPAPAPAPAVEAPARPRSEMLLAGVVVLLTAGGTLALLVARADPSTTVVSASTAGGSNHRSAGLPGARTAWAETAPRWTPNPDAWLGRTKGIAYEVSAAEPIGVWMRAVRPALVVRCVGGRTDVFVFTDSAAMIEVNTDDHTVEYAFDDEAPTKLRWPDGAEHNALFAPDGGAMAQRLQSAATFSFGFTPHNAQRVTARFNTSGLAELLKPAARHCGR